METLRKRQAGLFIVSITAQAQDEFLEGSGLKFRILKNEEEHIRQCLKELVEDYKVDRIISRSQFEIAKRFSWESINSELIEVWKE